MKPRHELLDLSSKRRVFVVGDLHGEYTMFEDQLAKHNFIPSLDAVVSVGDLADRGPESKEALEYIKEPWFYRSLGNHDVAPRLYLDGQFSKEQIDRSFGGAWFSNQSTREIEQIAEKLEDAPVALTVITPGGKRIGVVHADCCHDWEFHINALNTTWVYDLSLWSRETINKLMAQQQLGHTFDPELITIANIDHVFHGHTPLGKPFTVGNRSWIDTGACFGGTLTVWDIDDFIAQKENNT